VDRFRKDDIDAKAGGDVIPAGTLNRVLWEKADATDLLADRFKLSIHRQTKEMAAYYPVVAKKDQNSKRPTRTATQAATHVTVSPGIRLASPEMAWICTIWH
jgi:uncharacterized protein (TIGR03435 family)